MNSRIFLIFNSWTNYREKLHGFEYPLDEQIMIRPLLADTKPNPENIFPFEGSEEKIRT